MSGIDEKVAYVCSLCNTEFKSMKGFSCPNCIGPVSLDINFCEGCTDVGIGCDGCVRAHLNEVLDFNEDWRDNHSANKSGE